MNARRFDAIMLQTKTVDAKATPFGVEVTFAAAPVKFVIDPHGELGK